MHQTRLKQAGTGRASSNSILSDTASSTPLSGEPEVRGVARRAFGRRDSGSARETMDHVKARARPRRPQDQATAGFTCDFCGAVHDKKTRRQLLWDTRLGNLVLADLCGRCADRPGRLLERYGGRGRESMVLSEAPTPAPTRARVVARTEFALLRVLIYLLIALAFFLLVTLVTARS
jgi:hypothetical protein